MQEIKSKSTNLSSGSATEPKTTKTKKVTGKNIFIKDQAHQSAIP